MFGVKNGTSRASIRVLIPMIVVLPVLAVSAVLVALTSFSSEWIADDLGDLVVEVASGRVRGDVAAKLAHAVEVSDRYTRRVVDASLPLSGLSVWEKSMFEDLTSEPDIAAISFANPRGESTYLQRGENRLELGRVPGPEDGQAVEYSVGATGVIDPTPIRVYRYDARTRPWYTAAEQSPSPVWTPIYFWYGNRGVDSTTGTGFTRAIRDAAGKLYGVLVIDITLKSLSDLLRDIPLSRVGYIIIVDDHRLLVATSHGSANAPTGNRASFVQAENRVIRKTAEALYATDTTGRAPLTPGIRTLMIDGVSTRVQISDLSPYPGISWSVITIIPEAVVLGRAYRIQFVVIVVTILAVLASVALAIVLSRRITQPVIAISEHARRIGAADFSSRLDLRSARELVTLSQDLNRMAHDVRQRMVLESSIAVAAQVQKSLLPAEAPKFPGLEVFGRAKYCDEAGGDYVDFIVTRGKEQCLMCVIGDVMGHGIASALLMATVRGTLHAQVHTCGLLGELMSRINEFLAQDARHERFMTLSLLSVEPVTGMIRWASAGHDPAILYRPSEDSFTELDGAGVPLGIMTGMTFDSYEFKGAKKGDIIFLGTDGVWESLNPASEQYGKDRLREFLRRRHSAPLESIADQLEAELQAFRGGRPQNDDVTFIMVRLV